MNPERVSIILRLYLEGERLFAPEGIPGQAEDDGRGREESSARPHQTRTKRAVKAHFASRPHQTDHFRAVWARFNTYFCTCCHLLRGGPLKLPCRPAASGTHLRPTACYFSLEHQHLTGSYEEIFVERKILFDDDIYGDKLLECRLDLVVQELVDQTADSVESLLVGPLA